MSNQYLPTPTIKLIVALFMVLSINACGSGDTATQGINTERPAQNNEDNNSGNNSTTGGTDNASNTQATYPPGVLPSLPNPSLSPAPSADDEPLPEPAVFNAAVGFGLLREPGPRLPEDFKVALTDADFAAGPLPATYQIPADVDPQLNAAPYFDNLSDQQLFAGEVLEVLFKPIDPDGGVPGMFPEKLPEGASFIDNFDGSKTLRWQPLQMDVGIREFTVTAIDSVNSLYRTVRTIRIKIELPADLSSIPNVPPRLEEQFDYTARVGDPVVIELKGIDLNGPAPIIEINDLATGATLTKHLRYDEIYVLKTVPTTAGVNTYEVTVRDSIDSSLTAVETINLTVQPASAFERQGERLRVLAEQRSIKIGFASRHEFFHRPDSGLYTEIAAQEFDIVTPENALKMDYVNPTAGRYQFAEADNLVAFAQRNNMQVHGHTLVWHRQLPLWIEQSAVSERANHLREYIHRILSRYGNSISVWDVVNEPLTDDGSFRESVWYEAMGIHYIDLAFRQANESAPGIVKLLNDYDIAASSAKSEALLKLLDTLIERETPIDGVGFQMHIWSDFDQFEDVVENFKQVAARGLDIYITELDVSLAGSDDTQIQASVYEKIMAICLAQPRCKSLQTWGFTDQYSWRRNHQPLVFDAEYQPKPSYYSLQKQLDLQGQP